jgi:hypothetical protein
MDRIKGFEQVLDNNLKETLKAKHIFGLHMMALDVLKDQGALVRRDLSKEEAKHLGIRPWARALWDEAVSYRQTPVVGMQSKNGRNFLAYMEDRFVTVLTTPSQKHPDIEQVPSLTILDQRARGSLTIDPRPSTTVYFMCSGIQIMNEVTGMITEAPVASYDGLRQIMRVINEGDRPEHRFQIPEEFYPHIIPANERIASALGAAALQFGEIHQSFENQ